MKEEALKLFDDLASREGEIFSQACAMIIRLVDELDKQKETIRNLNKTLGFVNSGYEVISLEPQRKPLSEKELYEVFDKCYPNNGDGDVVTLVDFARAIEKRHGIK